MEFARVAAMVAVILVHAYSPLVSTLQAELGGPTWWTANVVDAAVRWCVAVFVMISGALLLRPREESAGDFYRKRWARIGVPLLVWSAAYLLWHYWREGIDAAQAAAQAASGSPSIHLYFLYVIAGLYLFTPFLRTVVAHTSRTGLWWLTGVAFAVGVADQLLSLVEGAGGASAVTRFLPFLGYYLLGWLLLTTDTGPRATRYGAVALVLGVAGTAAGAGTAAHMAGEWGPGGTYFYGFLSPPMILAGAGAYLVLRTAGTRLAMAQSPAAAATRRAVRVASGLSLGVYLVHVMVLYTLRDLWGVPDGFLALFAAAGYAVATAAISLVLVALAQRVPLLRVIV
ncbi:membrane protein [Nocardiopsis terrae]|uniref:Surface polysaccharide O-acyltransferase-like enzyme n=1 Tax=Nocardiopsis terrae TaxID=372655 RepID=A0ABR9HMM8_9ACTN|nr:acyltransferase family protein [Nocardiopsis terrae]MBE1460246.1 surface polysaccharide O-acyltransferase-like enzyme [Nocardiopsis terrae]GHC70456.1 membrane protein [Nocardiopsis terrae]